MVKEREEFQKVLIPVLDYYPNSFYTDNRTDKIVFLNGEQNRVTSLQIQNNLGVSVESNNCYGFLHVSRYIEMKYYNELTVKLSSPNIDLNIILPVNY